MTVAVSRTLSRVQIPPRLATDVGFAALCVLLAAIQTTAAARAGWPAPGVLGALQAALFATLFLVRRPASAGAWSAADVGLATGAVLLPWLLRPAAGGLETTGVVLQLAGGVAALAALLGLGRGFGVLPAHRGLCTTGLYGRIRHPMYAGYLVAYVGYVLCAPSLQNVALVLATTVVLHARVVREEALLARDPAYRAYCAHVPWRLVPAVY